MGGGGGGSQHLCAAEAVGRGAALFSAGADGALRQWHTQLRGNGDGGDGGGGGDGAGGEPSLAGRILSVPVRYPPVANRLRHKVRLATAPVDATGGALLFAPRAAPPSGAGSIAVLDAATGEELVALTAHHGDVNAVAWAHDAGELLSAGDDGLLLAWSGDLLRSGGAGRQGGGGGLAGGDPGEGEGGGEAD